MLPRRVEDVAWPTCCVSVVDVDAALFASPLYVAVIEWLPADSVDVVHDALPPLKVTAAQITIAPSLNVTVPVGDWPLTVALKVMLWPTTLGLVALPRLVVVAAGCTITMLLLAADAGPVPAALVAAMVKVYVPVAIGSKTMLVHGAVQEAVAPPGDAVAV